MADTGDDKEPYYADFTKSAKGPVSPFQKQVMDFVYWKNPQMSGGALAGGVVLYVLTSLRGYSYLALVSIVLLMHLFISIFMGQVSKFQGKVVPESKPLQIDPEYLKMGVDQLNVALAAYCALLSGKDMSAALKVMGGLWLSYCLGSWFEGPTLLVLMWIGAFSVPLGYQKNQKVVDEKLAIVQGKINDLTKQLDSKIPKADAKGDKAK